MADMEESPVLAEVYSRAGASDHDREAWLAERRQGITATEVRDLMLALDKSRTAYEALRSQMIDTKLGRRPEPVLANQYIAWGNTREPVIAEDVYTRFNIRPESRVFHAIDNPRLLASPDGIGVDFDENLRISEIKTGKDYLAVHSEGFRRRGYLYQITFAMRVLGARKCLYAWEQHDNEWIVTGEDWPEPTPGAVVFEWVLYDEELAETLVALAVDFLDHLDAAAASQPADFDAAVDEIASEYLEARAMESAATTVKKNLWERLQQSLTEHPPMSQEGRARVTWTPGAEETVPDEDAAREADPELWERLEAARAAWEEHQAKHTKTVPGRPRLTVTPIKEKKA